MSETWSSASSGSITSPKETTPLTPSSVNFNTIQPNPVENLYFSKDDYYAPFFIEDIFFGQDLRTNSRNIPSKSNDIDSSLYKLWSNIFGDELLESLLKERIARSKVFFPTTNPADLRTHYKNSYNTAYKRWPYPDFVAPVQNTAFLPRDRAMKLPLNYFNSYGHNLSKPNPVVPNMEYPIQSPYNEWSKFDSTDRYLDVPSPVFSASYTPRPTCSAEEVLNKYFSRECNLEAHKYPFDPDVNNLKSDFSFPISRTSTPLNNSLKDIKRQHMSPVVAPDVAGGLPTEYHTGKTRDFSPILNQNKLARQDPPSCENFTQTEYKATNATPDIRKSVKNNPSGKQYDFCKFCYKNGELSDIYLSHVTKSSNGNIICPILRKYVCDLCGATGDKAHTRKYCALNTQQNKKQPIFRRLTNGVLTTCHNHK